MEQTEYKEPLPFSMSEYESRVAKVKDEMDKRGLDVLMIFKPENYYYLTGFRGPHWFYTCLVFPREKDPMFILPLIEVPNARASSWVQRIEPFGTSLPVGSSAKDDPVAYVAQLLKNERLDKKTIGIELDTYWQTPLMYERLRQNLPDTRFVDSTVIIDSIRIIKSEAELDYMRQAGKILSKAMYAGINAVDEGKTENDVAAAVWDTLLAEGSEPISLGPFITSGPRTALHCRSWMNRRLNEGEPVYIEFPAAVKQYNVPMLRIVAVGEPSKEFREMRDVISEATYRGLNALKPGVTAGQVHDAIRETINQAGYEDYFVWGSAYSIGIGIPPRWSSFPFIQEKDALILQPGMVFHMVPVLMRHGMLVGESEPVAVTSAGYELLANVERKLFIR